MSPRFKIRREPESLYPSGFAHRLYWWDDGRPVYMAKETREEVIGLARQFWPNATFEDEVKS